MHSEFMNIICSVGEKYSMENSFKLVGTHYIHTLYSLPVSISDAFATLCTLRYTAIQGLRSWRRFLFKLSIHQLKHGTLHTAAHTRPTLVAHTHTHTHHIQHTSSVGVASTKAQTFWLFARRVFKPATKWRQVGWGCVGSIRSCHRHHSSYTPPRPHTHEPEADGQILCCPR